MDINIAARLCFVKVKLIRVFVLISKSIIEPLDPLM